MIHLIKTLVSSEEFTDNGYKYHIRQSMFLSIPSHCVTPVIMTFWDLRQGNTGLELVLSILGLIAGCALFSRFCYYTSCDVGLSNFYHFRVATLRLVTVITTTMTMRFIFSDVNGFAIGLTCWWICKSALLIRRVIRMDHDDDHYIGRSADARPIKKIDRQLPILNALLAFIVVDYLYGAYYLWIKDASMIWLCMRFVESIQSITMLVCNIIGLRLSNFPTWVYTHPVSYPQRKLIGYRYYDQQCMENSRSNFRDQMLSVIVMDAMLSICDETLRFHPVIHGFSFLVVMTSLNFKPKGPRQSHEVEKMWFYVTGLIMVGFSMFPVEIAAVKGKQESNYHFTDDQYDRCLSIYPLIRTSLNVIYNNIRDVLVKD